MPKYIIKQYETVVNIYEVEGDTMVQALMDFRLKGKGNWIDRDDFEAEANNELGESFDCLPEEISDENIVNTIRREFNENNNHDYLESIHSIEEAE